jgi:hypothetical protein
MPRFSVFRRLGTVRFSRRGLFVARYRVWRACASPRKPRPRRCAILRVQFAVADGGRHHVGDGDRFLGVFPQVIEAEPGELASLEVPGPELDALRRQLLKFDAGF